MTPALHTPRAAVGTSPSAVSLPVSPPVLLCRQINKLPESRALCRIRCRQVKRRLARHRQPPGKGLPPPAPDEPPGHGQTAEQPPQRSQLPGSCRSPWPTAGAGSGDGARVSLSPMLPSSPSPAAAAVPAAWSGSRHEELGSPGIAARSQRGEAEPVAVPGQKGPRPPSSAAPAEALPRLLRRCRAPAAAWPGADKGGETPPLRRGVGARGRAGCCLSPLPAAAQGCTVGRRTKPLSCSIKEGLCAHAEKRPGSMPTPAHAMPTPACTIPIPALPAACPPLLALCPPLPAPHLPLPCPLRAHPFPCPPAARCRRIPALPAGLRECPEDFAGPQDGQCQRGPGLRGSAPLPVAASPQGG